MPLGYGRAVPVRHPAVLGRSRRGDERIVRAIHPLRVNSHLGSRPRCRETPGRLRVTWEPETEAPFEGITTLVAGGVILDDDR